MHCNVVYTQMIVRVAKSALYAFKKLDAADIRTTRKVFSFLLSFASLVVTFRDAALAAFSPKPKVGPIFKQASPHLVPLAELASARPRQSFRGENVWQQCKARKEEHLLPAASTVRIGWKRLHAEYQKQRCKVPRDQSCCGRPTHERHGCCEASRRCIFDLRRKSSSDSKLKCPRTRTSSVRRKVRFLLPPRVLQCDTRKESHCTMNNISAQCFRLLLVK